MGKKIEKIEGAYDLPVIKKKLNQVIDYLNSESRPEGNYKLTIEDLEDIMKLIKEQNNDSVSIEYLMQYCGYLNTQPQPEEIDNTKLVMPPSAYDQAEKEGFNMKNKVKSKLLPQDTPEEKEEWEKKLDGLIYGITVSSTTTLEEGWKLKDPKKLKKELDKLNKK